MSFTPRTSPTLYDRTGSPTGWRRFAVKAPDLATQLADLFAFVAECEDWERKVDAFRYVR